MYRWILQDPQSLSWRGTDDVCLLWIEGGAGRGKTVSLVCKRLERVRRDEALSTIQDLPPGLRPLYDQVFRQLSEGDSAIVKGCMRLLKSDVTSLWTSCYRKSGQRVRSENGTLLKRWSIDVLRFSKCVESTSNLFINQPETTWLGRMGNLYSFPMITIGAVRLR